MTVEHTTVQSSPQKGVGVIKKVKSKLRKWILKPDMTQKSHDGKLVKTYS